MQEAVSEQENVNFATIAGVYSDGVTLIFDGEEEPSQKRYLCNTYAKFAKGQRVRIIKDSGTYIVEYPIGPPITTFSADWATSATSADQLRTARKISLTGDATGSANFSGTADVSISTNVLQATTATKATTSDRLTTARTIALTGDAVGSGSFSGAANLSIATKVGEVRDQSSSSGRSIQFRVTGAGVLQFKSSYYSSNNWYNMDGTRA